MCRLASFPIVPIARPQCQVFFNFIVRIDLEAFLIEPICVRQCHVERSKSLGMFSCIGKMLFPRETNHFLGSLVLERSPSLVLLTCLRMKPICLPAHSSKKETNQSPCSLAVDRNKSVPLALTTHTAAHPFTSTHRRSPLMATEPYKKLIGRWGGRHRMPPQWW